MKRNTKLYLNDILESIEKIEEFTRGFSKDDFLNAIIVQDAVMRRLGVIGEATKNIPEDFRKKYSEVEWKKVAGMRDILIHAYFGIKLERVWVVIKEDLPKLKTKIKKTLKEAEK